MDPKYLVLVLVIAFLILSLALHEAAHAWVANRCGDRTAKDLGRLTLNPIVHIDPLFTVVLPAVLYFTVGVVFGGAKPVPVVAQNLRHPTRDMMFVSLAGPGTNLVLAVVFMLAFKFAYYVLGMQEQTIAFQVLLHTVNFNILLAVFNMIPIPPLDGSRVMAYFLPRGLRASYEGLGSFGLILVFALIFFGPLKGFLFDAMALLWDGISQLTGGAWS